MEIGHDPLLSTNHPDTQINISSRFTLPESNSHGSVRGPLANLLLRRSFLFFLLLELAGLCLASLSTDQSWQTLGLGLMFPGAGFLLGGFWLHAGLIFIAFVLSAITAIAGNLLLPSIIWVSSTGWACYLAATNGNCTLYQLFGLNYRYDYWNGARLAVPVIVATTALLLYMRLKANRKRVAYKRSKAEQNLLIAKQNFTACPERCISKDMASDELNLRQLQSLRYVLNRSLQNVDRFSGFDLMDQFMSGALRYQLSAALKSLALYRYNYTPAFSGYVDIAQRSLIEKMLNKKVWSYWAIENLWGNLKWNPDPIIKDNVMYSGYLGAMVGAYMTVTGDYRYLRPGALTLTWSKKKYYSYDFNSLNKAMYVQAAESVDSCIPCEPGWVFPICNAFSMNSLIMCDRITGTSYAKTLAPSFKKTMEREYISQDGRFISARNRIHGIGFPMPTMLAGDGLCTFNFNSIHPQLAQRTWEVFRTHMIDYCSNGAPIYKRRKKSMDLGNYTKNQTFPLVNALLAANELGDREAAAAFESAIDEFAARKDIKCEEKFEKGSALSEFLYVTALMTKPSSLQELVNRGTSTASHTNPMLIDAPYPDVLVAKAVNSHNSLDLVLYPGSDNRNVSLVIGNLIPNQLYVRTGADEEPINVDSSGRSTIKVVLDGRTAIQIHSL